MRLSVDEALVEQARAIAPELRAHAEEGEREGKLPEASLKILREAGFHRLFVPRAHGGLEVDPVTHARIQEEISASDSAAGWSLMIASSSSWWSSRLAREGASELYADGPDLLAAVAFNPPAEARRVAGGYRLSGQRPFASCAHAARWMWMTAIVSDESGAPVEPMEVIGAFFSATDARIVDTWDALGMRATDSNDIAVDDVFVPEARTFRLPPSEEVGPGFEGPLYRTPAMLALGGYLPAVPLGVAREAIAEVRSIAAGKTPFSSATVLRERALAQAAIGKAEALLRSGRVMLYDALTDGWERTVAGEPFSLEQKGDLLLASTHAVQAAAEAVSMMYDTAGTTAVYKRSPLERHFRDAQVLKQHGFVSASRYATAGQIMFGVQPDLGFVHF